MQACPAADCILLLYAARRITETTIANIAVGNHVPDRLRGDCGAHCG